MVLLIVGVVLVTVLRPPMPASVTGSASGAVYPVSERAAAPDFTGIDGWLNSKPLTLSALQGHVVLVDFWTFSCVNCVRTIPHLQQLYDAYRNHGFVIVGVHSPEFDFEKAPANVAAAVRRLGVTWPVAIDSQMATWNAYRNEYWPAEYLLDQQGRIAYTSVGEGGYAETDAAVAQLLGTKAAAEPAGTPPPGDITPELYAGSDRGALADGEAYGPQGQPEAYPDSGPPAEPDAIQVTGSWADEGQYLVAAAPGHVRLRFHAGTVYVVAGTRGGPLSAGVSVDGAPVPPHLAGPALSAGGVSVSRQDLYELLVNESGGDHLLDLSVPAGFELYTFTFG